MDWSVCPYNEHHRMQSYSMKKHLQSCGFRPVVCPFNADHQLEAREYENHVKECSVVITSCPNNPGHRMPNKSLKKHLNTCPDRVVHCKFNYDHLVSVKNLTQHLNECEYRLVTCSYNPAHQMPAHLLEEHETYLCSTIQSTTESEEEEDDEGPNTYSCEICNAFSTTNFERFIFHLESDEGIQVSYYYKDAYEFQSIRVFSHFHCHLCKSRFASSATACRVRRKNGIFSLVEEYGMDCKKCCRKATMLTDNVHFVNKAKYLTIRKKYFPATEYDPRSGSKMLVGHKQELCGYCKKLGRLCTVTEL